VHDSRHWQSWYIIERSAKSTNCVRANIQTTTNPGPSRPAFGSTERPPLSPWVNWVSVLQLLALLPLPICVLIQFASRFGGQVVWGIAAIINGCAFGLYLFDKVKANAGDRRISEKALHSVEFLGGWPMALLAQRLLRHKSSKPSFQAIYWLIVIAHQILSLGYLSKWTFVLG